MSEHHFWTANRIEQLKDFWFKGRSAGEISTLFDEAVSRSAVIGKIHRLGIQRRPGALHVNAKKSTKTRQAGMAKVIAREFHTSVVWSRPAKPSLRDVTLEPVAEVIDLPIPLHQRKTISTLTPTCCRWPVGDPQAADFHFCGATKPPGLSYCQTHAQRAYRVVPVRVAVEQREKVGANE